MKLFLAGGISALKTVYEDNDMKLYLEEGGSIFEAVYTSSKANCFKGANILQSFYYCNDFTEKVIIPSCENFLHDSGAFTFFSMGKNADWNKYVNSYADFIKRNRIKHYFELDIDCIVGYENVLKFRDMLEQKTGVRCIPVWHKSRGIGDYYKMCEEYDYVALGGIVSKEITKPEYKYFPHFINEAHKRGAMIHGLGFTNLEGLTKYHFDSVDSTSWVSGNRFGHIYRFNGKTMVKYGKPPGMRLKEYKAAAVNNFNEWVKFAAYAERNL